MFSKFFEGLSLVIGTCLLMHTFFSDDRRATPAQERAETRLARRAAPRKRQAAYMAVGSSLLVYGLAEVLLRGM